MKNINQIKVGVVLSYLQMGLGMIISLLYTPLMLKFLGQSEKGLYNIASSVIAYLSLLTLGFGSSYVRYYIKYKKEASQDGINSLNALFITIFTVLGIIALLAGLVLANNCKLIFGNGLTTSELRIIRVLMTILSLNMAISFPASVFTLFIAANERFVFQKLVNMISTVFNPLITLLFLVMGYRSIGMTIVTTFITCITAIINIVFCISKLDMQFAFNKMDVKLLRKIACFSGFIALNMIVDEVNWNVDKFLLGRFRGSVATSIYAVAATLNRYFRNISAAITNVFIPRIHSLVHSENGDEKVTTLMTRIGRIQFMLLCLIYSGFVFFGKRFILLWAGKDYIDAYYITLVLMGPVIIPLIQSLGIEVQRAKNMHHFRSYVYLLMAIINIFLSIPLCIKLGGLGSAIGTAVSVVVANGIIMNIYYHKKIKINVIYFWKNIISILPALIVPILFVSVVTFFSVKNTWHIYVASILVYSILYCAFCWRFAMNQDEKRMFDPIIRKILRRY